MEIIKGKMQSAVKVVVYGPEGIGKSTFAAQFPEPLFIDTEGSTKHMDVARLQKPSSFSILKEEIQYVKTHPEICKTLIIDTIDWAEQLCTEEICAKHHKIGIEDFGYGNGYVYVKEEFGRFLNQLEDVVEVGINLVLTAHAQIRKFEQPDELGSYDRYELKLGKKTASQTSPLVKEWADMVLFANYKTYTVATDDKGKKHKAQGGKRVMYTSHHPCWDAKNRHGLNEELPFEYSEIAHIVQSNFTGKQPQQIREESKEIVQETSTIQEEISPEVNKISDKVAEKELDNRIPKPLRDLMVEYKVDEWDIQMAVASRGYYPSDTPIVNYDPNFINGVLVGAWKQVYTMIQTLKETEEIPFN